MPLPFVDAIEAKVFGHLVGGDPWNNVFHLTRPVDYNQATINTLGGAIAGAYSDAEDLFANVTTFEGVLFRDLSEDDQGELLYTSGILNLGVVDTEAMPPQVAGLVSWRTATGGRKGRGRSYLPGVCEEANTAEGGPHEDIVAVMNTWATAMLALAEDLVIVSYFEGHTWEEDDNGNWHKIPTPREVPLASVVTSGTASGTWATMRSRNNRR